MSVTFIARLSTTHCLNIDGEDGGWMAAGAAENNLAKGQNLQNGGKFQYKAILTNLEISINFVIQ